MKSAISLIRPLLIGYILGQILLPQTVSEFVLSLSLEANLGNDELSNEMIGFITFPLVNLTIRNLEVDPHEILHLLRNRSAGLD